MTPILVLLTFIILIALDCINEHVKEKRKRAAEEHNEGNPSP